MVDGSYISVPEEGTLKLDLLELRANSHLTYPTNLNFELGELLMRYASVLEAEKIHLKSTFVYIEGDASINTAGRGPGAGLGKAPGVITSTSSYIGSGAGHGGYGGGADVVNFSNGTSYGSYVQPAHPGSGGAGNYGGAGGSTMRIEVGQELHLDGNILNDGTDATGGNSGGGSGGSIWVSTLLFSGHGYISTNGGDGFGLGYGGAGGRIAVHVGWRREFSGIYEAFGGLGGPNNGEDNGGNAAGGTVYYTDTNQGLNHRKALPSNTSEISYEDGFTKLLLDNDNRNHALPTVIENDEGAATYEIDEVEINNHVVLWLHEKDARLTVHKFIGDRTGLLHMRYTQVMYCEVVESMSGITVAPVSYKIDAGTEVVFPSTLFILGTRSHIDGLITGVMDVYFAKGADTIFTSTTQTALLKTKSTAL
ncbi:hypothetical protein BSL78_07879 [Apostichopus japonicus]|uniref:Uncharacterized protein n=1 Tax=Stichopus japonicus TaxID=307972 RepID=A0A2G8L4F5_STIJA|nr:hypothetical protein BSL78_07879 [Apostichopus japonicus]